MLNKGLKWDDLVQIGSCGHQAIAGLFVTLWHVLSNPAPSKQQHKCSTICSSPAQIQRISLESLHMLSLYPWSKDDYGLSS